MTTELVQPVRRPIRPLPQPVVNQIAAGEVIERPASVVKELLENAVDAGAQQIEVSISQGGLEEIRVTDDGCGIPRDELQWAIASHATSKIADADELFQVGTLGFRGEALASIASVSHLEIRSRTADSDLGFEMRGQAGEMQPIEPCGMPVGTSLVVRNLFFNTPVRRKFLRTPPTELGHVAEAFTRIALAYLDRQFTLIHNERTLFHLPATDDWSARIREFFGDEVARALIPIDREHDSVRLSGFVVDPSVSRSNNRLQYLFLNGRYIRDRSLQHALGEAYRGLLMVGRYPICFLRLEMPSEWVDVNVHPAKLEVRFQDGSRLYSHLLATIRDKFLTTDLTARGQLHSRSAAFPEPIGSTPASQTSPPNELPQSRIDFPSTPVRNWIDQPKWVPRPQPPAMMPARAEPSPIDSPFAVEPEIERAVPSPAMPPPSEATTPANRRLMALQVQDTYLVTETDEGLVVIDQHALHERVLYEQLRERVESGGIECQRLLVPEPVQLRPVELAAILDSAQSLRRLGIDVEPFGGDTLLVTAYPAMLSNHNPGDLLRGLVDLLTTEGAAVKQRDLFDELLHMIACKAAIKAGDRLSWDEIDALLEHRQLCRDAHHCPHGRPTALIFSREDLDRKFKRT
mgnify:CR=1 FL=1